MQAERVADEGAERVANQSLGNKKSETVVNLVNQTSEVVADKRVENNNAESSAGVAGGRVADESDKNAEDQSRATPSDGVAGQNTEGVAEKGAGTERVADVLAERVGDEGAERVANQSLGNKKSETVVNPKSRHRSGSSVLATRCLLNVIHALRQHFLLHYHFLRHYRWDPNHCSCRNHRVCRQCDNNSPYHHN